VNLSTISGGYGGGQAQRLLASLMQLSKSAQQDSPSGQTGSANGAAQAGGPPAGPPAGPPPAQGARAFASDTLSSLLSVQEQSASDPISALMQLADSDGDGALSLDEIKATLGDQASDKLSEAMAKLDTDQDGKLSTDELTAAFQAKHAGHAHGHRGARPSTDELASRLLGDVDTDGDGALSLDEAKSVLGVSDDAASAKLADGFGKLDSDGDGKLSASELSAALSAFRPHGRGAASADVQA
jgi:Ca2+-binding EF-hand superfamily protein